MTPSVALLQAASRRAAASRRTRYAPRPATASVHLPPNAEAQWEAGRVHRLRLHIPGVDRRRFRRALHHVAHAVEALQFAVRVTDGRCEFVSAPEPVVEVAEAAELMVADDQHPVRYAHLTAGDVERDVEQIELSIGAHLIDRSCWAAILRLLETAYNTDGPVDDAERPGLRYGDHCHRRSAPDASPASGTSVADRGSVASTTQPPSPGDQPLVRAHAASPYGVLVTPVSGPGEYSDPAPQAIRALRSCGWNSDTVSVGGWSTGESGMIGASAEFRVTGHLVDDHARADDLAPIADRADSADHRAAIAGPRCDLTVSTLDLPLLRFGTAEADVVVLPSGTGIIDICLMRCGEQQQLVVGGPETLLSGYSRLLVDELSGTRTAAAATIPSVSRPPNVSIGDVCDLSAPGVQTVARALSAEIIGTAVRRRTAELRAAGAGPGIAVTIELPPGPELVANLFAAVHCEASVLLLDPDDPPDWRDALRSETAAVRVDQANRVTPPDAPVTAQTPGLRIALSATPGRRTIAIIDWHQLGIAAATLSELWSVAGEPIVLNTPVAGEDFVVRCLAAAAADVGVLIPRDEAELVDLVGAAGSSCVELHPGQAARLPLARFAPRVWSARSCVHRGAPSTAARSVTRWWVAEAPESVCVGAGDELYPLTPGFRIVGTDDLPLPSGAVGELRVPTGTGTGYCRDPRRTADRLRPRPGGGRELRTGVIAVRTDDGFRVVEPDHDRTVVEGRTILLDPLRAAVGVGVVGVHVPDLLGGIGTGSDEAERCWAVVLDPPAPPALQDLPAPLRNPWLVCDPRAADLPPVAARALVAQAIGRTATGTPSEPATTPTERAVAEQALLPVLGMSVGRDDNLFALGVTSLQLVRISLQVRESMGADVPLGRLFGDPTLRTLAAVVDEHRAGSASVTPDSGPENHRADSLAAAMDLLDEVDSTASNEGDD
ncbi:phosphopantetheine-binding protein [Microlunatus soli]|uniref:Acyl-CoA synthetase (AMP-forming)/AMP-acid ligase II n=1 Tax=Microlunatus soli TaxID=630515 RepID=A0A1H1VSV6_9ACTN|nr:phosphopantetheine-binding protein [Microlunatus soli]SDS87843.1 Acyl-CoA synthetase (AMP-forming)/AMP-acid ligase II [Microlunatus soli]